MINKQRGAGNRPHNLKGNTMKDNKHLTYQKAGKLIGIRLTPKNVGGGLILKRGGRAIKITPVEMNKQTATGNYKKRCRITVK